MAKTVVGLFDTMGEAQRVVQDLMDSGFSRDAISLVAQGATDTETVAVGDTGAGGAAAGLGVGAATGGVLGLLIGLGALAIPGIGPIIAAGPLAAAIGTAAGAATGAAVGAAGGAVVGGLLGALVDAGVPEEEAHVYTEGVRRGGTLVMVSASDVTADNARSIMSRHGAVDIDERGTSLRQSGWDRFDPEAKPYHANGNGHTSGGKLGEKWEESSKVGTVGGTVAGAATGAAAGSVAGPVGTVAGGIAGAAVGAGLGAAGDAAGEGIEDETFDPDTPAERARAARRGFDTYDTDFRSHYKTYSTSSGYTYEQYEPVYRYGYNLAYDPAFTGSEWGAVEPEARRRWEERNPNTWDQFKDSVRYAWDKVRGVR